MRDGEVTCTPNEGWIDDHFTDVVTLTSRRSRVISVQTIAWSFVAAATYAERAAGVIRSVAVLIPSFKPRAAERICTDIEGKRQGVLRQQDRYSV